MKQSTTQRILEVAKKHPNGFTATDVRAVIKGKPERIYVALSTLKKKGVLEHNSEMGRYMLKSVPVTVPKPDKKRFDSLMEMVREENIKIEREDAAAKMLDNMLKEVQETEEKYQDALAIIRYLESKLVTAIQHDARSRS